MTTKYRNLREVLADHKSGGFNRLGEATNAIDTLVLALGRRNDTIRDLRKRLDEKGATHE